jgi:hypothetical protein
MGIPRDDKPSRWRGLDLFSVRRVLIPDYCMPRLIRSSASRMWHRSLLGSFHYFSSRECFVTLGSTFCESTFLRFGQFSTSSLPAAVHFHWSSDGLSMNDLRVVPCSGPHYSTESPASADKQSMQSDSELAPFTWQIRQERAFVRMIREEGLAALVASQRDP